MGRLPELGKTVPSIFFFFCFFIFFIIREKMAVGNCKKCGKAIVRAANLTEYKGAKYHSGCFNCAGCGANITGPEGFINHQEKLYCHACYEKDIAEKCKKCQKAPSVVGVFERVGPTLILNYRDFEVSGGWRGPLPRGALSQRVLPLRR